MQDLLLLSALHLLLDICLASAEAALHADSKNAVLKYMHCQNLHADTKPTTIANKYIHKFSVCNKTWYESLIISGNPLALLSIKMV